MKRLIIPLGAVGLAMTFAVVASVQAQTAPQPQPPAATDHGMMGGMKEGKGMMGMMQRMSRMMEQCDRMMQERQPQPDRPDRPPG